jgi:hypothetical protein
MVVITKQHIARLVQIESKVHYSIPPDPPRRPFVIIERESPILLSAPHGAICLRNNQEELWHEEDEYTASMAILLGELCNTSVIATTWKTIDSDPNYHFETRSLYKREIRRLVESKNIKWVFDLHGASSNSKVLSQDTLVDIGSRKEHKSFNPETLNHLKEKISRELGGSNYISENKFPAYATKNQMSITAFCHEILDIDAVQIEMKPLVRIPVRRIDSSAYLKGEHFIGQDQKVVSFIQALAEVIEYLLFNFSVHKLQGG